LKKAEVLHCGIKMDLINPKIESIEVFNIAQDNEKLFLFIDHFSSSQHYRLQGKTN